MIGGSVSSTLRHRMTGAAHRCQRAASGLTYGILVGLVAVVAIAAIARAGGGVNSLFGTVAARLSGATPRATVNPSANLLVDRGGAIRGWGDGTVSASCAAYRTPSAPYSYAGFTGSGIYLVGASAASAEQVLCDMVTQGGGWTHIATIDDADGNDRWSQFAPPQDAGLWDSTATLAAGAAPVTNADYKNAAYGSVTGTQLLITDGPSASRPVLYTQADCWGSASFRSFISSLQWRAVGSDTSWSDSSGAHLCTFTGLADDTVLRATAATGASIRIGFKWGEANGAQDGNRDRTMITTNTVGVCGGATEHVDCPAGLGAFTDRIGQGSIISYEDAMHCRGADSPNDCGHTNETYQLWIR